MGSSRAILPIYITQFVLCHPPPQTNFSCPSLDSLTPSLRLPLIFVKLFLHRQTNGMMLKGCGMGPWLVLVSPCFRGNVVATCQIRSFLCSLDNLLPGLLQLFSFLEIKFQNCAHWKKGLFLTYFSHFLVTREKLQKFLQHISHSHTYTYFAHPIDFFCLTNFEKKYEYIRYGFSLVWVLVFILIRAILKQSINIKMVSKI